LQIRTLSRRAYQAPDRALPSRKLSDTELEANILLLDPVKAEFKHVGVIKVTKAKEGDRLNNPITLVAGKSAFFYYQKTSQSGKIESFAVVIPVTDLTD
jgi:hypothetical protein